QKQKIEHAAQSGAIVGAAQPTGDMDPNISNPDSLQTVVGVVFNALAADGVLPLANQGSCVPANATVTNAPGTVTWTYTVSGCSSVPSDMLTMVINRGVVTPGPPDTVSTSVAVSYPYHWRFNSVIQLLLPGATYAATTLLTETSA